MRSGRRNRSLVPLLLLALLAVATAGLLFFYLGLGRLRDWLAEAEAKAVSGMMAQGVLEPEMEAALGEAVREATGETPLGSRPID